jgi:hypothetical protein
MACMKAWFIHVDALPVWALGAYGNEWFSTPHVDALAARSVIFDQHFADVPRPLHPETFRPFFPWCSLHETLEFPNLQWINYDMVLPDDAGHSWNTWTQAVEHAVTVFDRWLGDWLSTHDIRDQWVIVSSGRGIHFPHADWLPAQRWNLHESNLHESVVHLPLIVHVPRDVGAGRRVLDLSQTPDLAATCAELSGTPTTEVWHGRSLVPLCHRTTAIRPYAIMATPDESEWALQTFAEKIVVKPHDPQDEHVRFFIKPDDRWEACDLHQVHFDYSRQLKHLLTYVRDLLRKPGPVNYPEIPQEEQTNGHCQTG